MLKTNAVKRISAFSLALMMILGTLPLNVFAEGLQGKESGSAIVDSNTIKEEPAKEEKDSMAKSEQHIISFNPNGGSGEMKPIEVADGKNYTLPKNEFKAPEGKKFKSWTFEEDEQKEGYVLTVTRDLELKANWEDVKTESAPKVKEDAGKESDKLELSDSLASSTVMASNDSRYALFKSEPELLTNGEVDLASKDEKSQGKFNKITSLKIIRDPNAANIDHTYLLKIKGKTNTTFEKQIELGLLIQLYSLNKDKLNLSDSPSIIEKNLPIEKRGDPEYVFAGSEESASAPISDNLGNTIGVVGSQIVKINNIPDNVNSVEYECIITIKSTVRAYGYSSEGQKNLKEDIFIYDVGLKKDPLNKSQKELQDLGINPIAKANTTVEKTRKYSPKVTFNRKSVSAGEVEVDSEKNLYTKFVSVSQDGPLSSGLIFNNTKSLFSKPFQYISKENKLTYRFEPVHENWDTINFSNTYFSKSVYPREDRVVEQTYNDGVEINDFLYARLVEYNDIYRTTFTNIGGESTSVYGALGVIGNFSTDVNGNFEFQYYNEGSDLRTAISGSGNFPEEINKKINASQLKLKDFSLINEDGTYDIPIYRVTIYKNGKEIAKSTINTKGRVRLNSGKALSELYKITYEKGIVEEREIPVIEKRIADNTLLKGEEKVVQQGEVGKEKVTYDKQFVNGKFFGKVNEKTQVIKPMKPRIIHYGTAEKLVNKTTETVKYDTIYEADQTLKYEEKKTTQQGKNGSKDVTTTTTLVNGKRQESKNEVVTVKPTSEIIKVGNKKVDEEKLPFKTIEQIDKTLKEGQTKIKVKGVEGLKTTTTIYEVDKKTGKLTNPKETVTTKNPVDQVVLKGTKPDSIKTSIEAKVKYFGVGGAEEKPEAGKYKFVLKDNKGKVVSEATNDKNGNIVFKELNITDKEIGNHKYTVEQVKGDDLTIEYDTHVEDVTVDVSLSDDNKLSAKVTYDKDGAVFGNRLNTTSIQFVRLAEGEKPFVAEEVKNDKGLVVSHKISDKDKAKTLDGAEYDIYKINSDGTETKVTSIKTENGISNLVENLVPGKYKLKETKAPKGYLAASKDLEFEITKEDAGKALVKFASGEDNGAGGKIMEMPSTGGQGTKALMIGGGVLLIVMAGVFVLANIKKKELNK